MIGTPPAYGVGRRSVGLRSCTAFNRTVTFCMPVPPPRPSSRRRAEPEPALPFAPAQVAPRRFALVRLVAELQRRIGELGRVVVEGEVHDPRRRPDGRWYFTLKDRAAQLDVTVNPRAKRARVVAGERVAVTGVVVMQPARGSIRIEADEVVPVGDGAVAAMIAESRERLRADGVLDRPRRALPLLPRSLIVVCGSDAAVKHDIRSVADERFPGFPIGFVEVTMSSPDGIAAAVDRAWRVMGADVIVIARGGGDATHLLPFSDLALCRTIAASPVPVVSAIGHQNDRPLCDEVADARAATPSMAATMVVPELAQLRGRLAAALAACALGAERRIDRGVLRLGSVGGAWMGGPDALLARAERRLAAVDLERAVERRVADASHRLASLARDGMVERRLAAAELSLRALDERVEALSPERVLARGYAIVRDVDGQVIRDPSTLAVGDAIVVRVQAGSVDAVVRGTRAAPST